MSADSLSPWERVGVRATDQSGQLAGSPASPHPAKRTCSSPLPEGAGTPPFAREPLPLAPRPSRRGQDRRLATLIWARLRRDRVALAAAVFLIAVILAALLAPWMAPRDPLRQDPSLRLAPPFTPAYPLGADHLGRDILSRLIWGGQVSLVVGIVPVLLSAIIGVALGLLGGYYGGRVDNLLMRALDVIFAFPAILLALAIVATLGPSISNAMLAITVVAVPSFARLIRASVLSLKAQSYVEAARALGAGGGRIVGRHILPNSISPVVVYGTLETGKTIVFAASLSFLGLGVQPPTPEWGAMLSDGRNVLAVAPHVSTIPGLMIFVVTLSFNVLGDALRDALDPRLRH
jgi:peptide/nickel transport system permease protein